MPQVQRAAEQGVAAALISCVRVDSSDLQVATAVAGVDMSVIAKAATFHGVAPLVHHRLLAAGLASAPSLADAGRAQLMRHLVDMATLREVKVALDAAGVDWLVFKGPLIATAYERPDLRSYADVDLLVDRRQLDVALSVLLAAGCSMIDRNWPLINSQTRGEMSLMSRQFVPLDVHWTFINEPRTRLSVQLPVEAMLARRVPTAVGNMELPGLEPHDELAYVAMHALLSGGHRLVWLVDLDRLIRDRHLDWAEVVRAARRDRLALPLAIGIERAQRYLGTDVPRGVVRQLAPLIGWRGVVAAVDAFRSPVQSFAHGKSGRIFAQAFRGTSASTVVGLSQEIFDRRARRLADPMVHNPLHEDVPDDDARSRYLDRVMSEAPV